MDYDVRMLVAESIAELRGSGAEQAYHRLVDATDDIIPIIGEHIDSELDPSIRKTLLRVVWQHRVTEALPIIAKALLDAAPEVWKEAMDGLVGLELPGCKEVLGDPWVQARACTDYEFGRYVQEATRQLSEL